MAASLAPRLPRTMPFTWSRCRKAPLRPRWVAIPSDSIVMTASKSFLGRWRYGYACRVSSYRSSSRQGSHAAAETICWAKTSRGHGGISSASRPPRRMARTRAAHSSNSSRVVANRRPFGILAGSTRCPERPIRCTPTAMERGEPIWQTRSTDPMSMPSSRDAVATTARSSPCFNFCSASSLKLRERLPWCARTALSPSRSAR